MQTRKSRLLLVSFGSLLCTIVVLVTMLHLRRPPRQAYQAELFQGVSYTRRVRDTPRPLVIHLVEIDLQAPGIDFLVTPGDTSSGLELPARTTSRFAQEFGVQVAINGSFFRPFRVGYFLFDFYPHTGDPVNVIGLAIANGEAYSVPDQDAAVLCIGADKAEIRRLDCPPDTTQALAGDRILVDNGQAVSRDNGALHPRTVVAVDEAGTRLWLIVVDGRQPGYSEGVTRAELAETIVSETGAWRALNLDGGGSSALVIAQGKRVRSLNVPIHKRMPMWQRPVANHLGVYAQSK